MSALQHVPTLEELAARGLATVHGTHHTPTREGQQMIYDAMAANAAACLADDDLRRQTETDAIRAARGRA